MAEHKANASVGRGAEEPGVEAVARYLADMTGQLESMARASKLELLAYLLAMARAEAESLTVDGRHDLSSSPR